MVRAGFAFTLTSLPNAILLPAFCAGLLRVFTMHTPGMVNLPVDFTSFVTNSARASKTLPNAILLPAFCAGLLR